MTFAMGGGPHASSPQFQENICFIDYTKAFDCVDQYKLLKILKEIGMPDHFTCLLRNLYSGEEHGTMDWFKIGKKYDKAVYCYPTYLTYMKNTLCVIPGWMTQAGNTIARRNINNPKYTDDTILMAESEETASL